LLILFEAFLILWLFKIKLNFFKPNSSFYELQVIDLDECTMEDGLKWCQLIGNSAKKCFCLIAGGDGTIG
jgi:hypothetical protein